MARKIAVLDERDAPTTYVKKTVARLLVHRLLAVWIVKNLSIRRVEVKDAPADAVSRYVPGLALKPYIPATLPFAELPGIKVEHPKNRARFVLGITELRPCDE